MAGTAAGGGRRFGVVGAAATAANSFTIFCPRGLVLFHREWYRPRNQWADKPENMLKVLFGMLLGLEQQVGPLFTDEAGRGPSSPPGTERGCVSLRTRGYSLFQLVTPTRLRFVFMAGPDVGDLQPLLRRIYADCYRKYVVCNPLQRPGEAVRSAKFAAEIEKIKQESFPST